MLVNPTHVVKQLAEGLVATLRQLQFDHDELSVAINCQEVYATAANRVFNAITLRRSIQTQARLDAIKVFG